MHGGIFYQLKVYYSLSKRIFSSKSICLLTKFEIFIFLFRPGKANFALLNRKLKTQY